MTRRSRFSYSISSGLQYGQSIGLPQSSWVCGKRSKRGHPQFAAQILMTSGLRRANVATRVKKLLNGGSIASAWRNSYDRSNTSGKDMVNRFPLCVLRKVLRLILSLVPWRYTLRRRGGSTSVHCGGSFGNWQIGYGRYLLLIHPLAYTVYS